MDGRIVVIGIDGATWDLLGPWMEEGELPNLEKLRKGGRSGVLKSTVPPASLPAWPSMVTGKNPGKHGIFDLGSGALGAANPWPVYDHGPWHLLENTRMAFVNVPGTYPLVEKGVNGYVVSGMFTPTGNWEDFSEFVYPGSFADELEEVVDDYFIDLWVLDHDRFLERANEAVENRGDVFRYVLENKDVDLFWGVFTSPDRLMHKFWGYADGDHPLHGTVEEDHPHRDALKDHFRRIDRKIGEILDILDDEDLVFIVSDHGFQGNYQSFDLPGFLERQGYMRRKKDGGKTAMARLGLHRDNAEKLFRTFGGEILLEKGSKKLRLWLKELSHRLPSPEGNTSTDTENSLVRVSYSGHTIEVNTAAKGGPVPDREKDAVKQAVIGDLESFMEENGLEGEVSDTDDYWHGPRTEELPDIYWFFEHVGDQGTGGEGKLLTSIENVVELGKGRKGNAWHHRDGVYIVNCPGVVEGEGEESIYSVVPTLTALLEGVVDESVDGGVMDSLSEYVGRTRTVQVSKTELKGVEI